MKGSRFACIIAVVILAASTIRVRGQAAHLKVQIVESKSGLDIEQEPIGGYQRVTIRNPSPARPNSTNSLPGSTDVTVSEQLLIKEDHSYRRTETYKVSLTNMGNSAVNFTVLWHFLARDLRTHDITMYDQGSKSVLLKGGAFTSFGVRSKPLEALITSYHYSGSGPREVVPRKRVGDKPEGYIFVVKAGEKILAVEASDQQLKNNYLNGRLTIMQTAGHD